MGNCTKTVFFAMIVTALVIMTILTGCSKARAITTNVAAGYVAGKPAPVFRLPDLDGRTTALSQFQGRTVLLNFWTTWCPACKEELPLIQASAADPALARQGSVILTIDIGEDRDTVLSFMANNHYSFATLLDSNQAVAEQYNVWSIPSTFIIDKDGIIKDIKIGPFNSESEIRNALTN